jgi:hypothetical protein
MIGTKITDPTTGLPLEQYNKLAKSNYAPPLEVMKLFAQVQRDYETAWMLQHRSFDEFDGVSLLQRARLDQETFSAYVGAKYLPIHKRWRWRGRKNTARNKLIGILAHIIAGMLYPYVNAKNEENEEDKDTAKVMRILVEEHLRKADYELKFLFLALSALVNPAVIVEVEYLQAMQKIKEQLANGEVKITEAVDELLSGLSLNVLPVDEFLPADFYTPDVQRQPFLTRVRRIPYDLARKIYSGKWFYNEKDLFDFVEAGKTKILLTGQEGQTLHDVDWTEADSNYVQEISIWYKDEDLELCWVGGVGMFNYTNPYNTNPFKHRRFTLIGKEWKSIPVYPFAKGYFEPIDPTGRFFYGKSGAFKEYWDALSQDKMHQLAHDGTYLDVIKPLFLSGVTKADSTVLVPGATIGMPAGATMTPYQLGPNLVAALNMMNVQKEDMSESTQDKIMSGGLEKGVTAYATSKAEQNARVFLGVFGIFISDLIKQVGELTMDCVIRYATVGELNTLVPEALAMKYQTFLAKGKDRGKEITNKVIFTDKYIGREMTKKQKEDIEWDLYDKTDGTDQRIFMVNPYQFARHTYTLYIDSDQIVRKSAGLDREEKVLAFNMLTDPRVAPFTDQKEVVDEFVIEQFTDDPERFKRKGNPDEMMNSVMSGMMGPSGGPALSAQAGKVEPPKVLA